MADRQKMQAAGDADDAAGEAARGAAGSEGAGESGGGAYPNPHEKSAAKNGFMGHGGQTDIAYHGPGQLGDDDVTGEEQPNSGTKRG